MMLQMLVQRSLLGIQLLEYLYWIRLSYSNINNGSSDYCSNSSNSISDDDNDDDNNNNNNNNDDDDSIVKMVMVNDHKMILLPLNDLDTSIVSDAIDSATIVGANSLIRGGRDDAILLILLILLLLLLHA